MTTASISYQTGATLTKTDVTSRAGEALVLTVTLTNADGTARDCSTGVVQWCIQRRGSLGPASVCQTTGLVGGVHVLTIPSTVTAPLDGQYQVTPWYVPAAGTAECIGDTSTWTITRAVGPNGIVIVTDS